MNTIGEIESAIERLPGPQVAELAAWLEQLRARRVLDNRNCSDSTAETFAIPPGIRRSQDAFWRDLPQLLENRHNHGRWVCYSRDERIGIADDDTPLLQECLRRGLRDDEYYVAVIRTRQIAPWEPEEVESLGPHHLEDSSSPT